MLQFLPTTVPQLLLWIGLVLIVGYLVSQLEIVDERFRRPVWIFGKLRWIAGPGLTCILKPLMYQTEDVMVISRPDEFKVEDVPTLDNTPVRFKGKIIFNIEPKRVADYVLKMADGKNTVLDLAATITAGLIRESKYSDIKGHQEDFCSKITKLLNNQVNIFAVNVTYIGIIEFDITDESTRDSMAIQGRTTQDLASYNILAEQLAPIAAKVGLPVGRMMELHIGKQMNSGVNGGFAFMMGEGQLPLAAVVPALSEKLPGIKSPAAEENPAKGITGS